MLIAIKGKKNSGKTLFIENLLKKLKGYKVVVVKSSMHEAIDEEGKDTWRYRGAGAIASIISTKKEIVLFTKGTENKLKDAINIAKKFFPDVIIVEGYKSVEGLNCIDVEEADVEEVYEKIVEKIVKGKKIEILVDGKEISLNKFVEKIFYETIKAMLSCLKGGEGKEIEILIRL
ncbi:molybdopterin-guanine dinucleotide biosynthesis protein B [Thermoplasmatales archaeon ex4484_30]|nr:MAG: molybdopterin-guanine dinucleotide biosynthesis protein B [Thermoplasmatales archaeon ex4484_30]